LCAHKTVIYLIIYLRNLCSYPSRQLLTGACSSFKKKSLK